MGTDKVVSDPTEVVLGLHLLASLLHRQLEFKHAPGKKAGGEGHWKAEFHMVSGIVPAAGQIEPHTGAVL